MVCVLVGWFVSVTVREWGLWGADGTAGRPFPTQTGQRSGELTANSG